MKQGDRDQAELEQMDRDHQDQIQLEQMDRDLQAQIQEQEDMDTTPAPAEAAAVIKEEACQDDFQEQDEMTNTGNVDPPGPCQILQERQQPARGLRQEAAAGRGPLQPPANQAGADYRGRRHCGSSQHCPGGHVHLGVLVQHQPGLLSQRHLG